jgi:hypothetical protein
MVSMNYFDYSWENLTYFFEVEVSNGSVFHNKNPLTFMFTVVFPLCITNL